MTATDDLIVVGRIAGLYGVRGWVKVFSHTEPRENIFSYNPWLLLRDGRPHELKLAEGRPHGKALVARLEGIADRDEAALWLQCDIAIRREQLPAAGEGEYYWSQLIGLAVVNTDGVELGVVKNLMETGANDVLVVSGERERLIPYTEDAVLEIDLEGGQMRVDWDPEF